MDWETASKVETSDEDTSISEAVTLLMLEAALAEFVETVLVREFN
jgi:hypothetical protein